MSKIKQDQLLFWKSLIPELNKIKEQLLLEVKRKQIHTMPPQDFQFKTNQIKSKLQQGEQLDDNQYIDVFAYMVQEKINLSQNQLIDQFIRYFGQDSQFWKVKIDMWATQFIFTSSLIIWSVNNYLKNYVNYVGIGPADRQNVYIWRLRVQAYISSIQFLLHKIQKLKDKDGPYFVDEAYVKYHKQKQMYKTFMSTFGSNTVNENFNQVTQTNTVTFQNKSKAQKKLFNFSLAKNIDSMNGLGLNNSRVQRNKSINTIQKYFGKGDQPKKYNAEQIQIPTDQQQRKIEHQKFLKMLQKIGQQNFESLQNLRSQFVIRGEQQRQQWRRKEVQQKQEQKLKTSKKIISRKTQPPKQTVEQIQNLQTKDFKQYPLSHLTFIFKKEDYYQTEGMPMGRRDIDISKPFIFYDWVNYQINDEEEYQQMMAVAIADDQGPGQSISSASFENGQNRSVEQSDQLMDDDTSFIDNRKFILGGDVDQKNLAPQDKMEFVICNKSDKDQWVSNYKNVQCNQTIKLQNHRVQGCQMIPVYSEQQLPYQIKKPLQAKISEIKSQRSRNTIVYQMQQISQDSQQDNSTTGRYNNSRPQQLPMSQPVVYNVPLNTSNISQNNHDDEIKMDKNNTNLQNEDTTYDYWIDTSRNSRQIAMNSSQNINQNNQNINQNMVNQQPYVQKMQIEENRQQRKMKKPKKSQIELLIDQNTNHKNSPILSLNTHSESSSSRMQTRSSARMSQLEVKTQSQQQNRKSSAKKSQQKKQESKYQSNETDIQI